MTTTPKQTIVFSEKGTFKAYYAACDWLNKHGYSHGSMSAPFPTAIKKGDYNIAKWKNLTAAERADADGVIEGEFREGPVTVRIFNTEEVQP